jgi:hypothetical protein
MRKAVKSRRINPYQSIVPGDRLSARQRERKAAQLSLMVIGTNPVGDGGSTDDGTIALDVLESSGYLIL